VGRCCGVGKVVGQRQSHQDTKQKQSLYLLELEAVGLECGYRACVMSATPAFAIMSRNHPYTHLSRNDKAERFDCASGNLERPGDLVLTDIQSSPREKAHATLCIPRDKRVSVARVRRCHRIPDSRGSLLLYSLR
jgi:hypothetical protein